MTVKLFAFVLGMQRPLVINVQGSALFPPTNGPASWRACKAKGHLPVPFETAQTTQGCITSRKSMCFLFSRQHALREVKVYDIYVYICICGSLLYRGARERRGRQKEWLKKGDSRARPRDQNANVPRTIYPGGKTACCMYVSTTGTGWTAHRYIRSAIKKDAVSKSETDREPEREMARKTVKATTPWARLSESHLVLLANPLRKDYWINTRAAWTRSMACYLAFEETFLHSNSGCCSHLVSFRFAHVFI